MKLSELQDGQVVRGRCGRYLETLEEPQWSPWQDLTLYIQRHGNRIVCITIEGGSWAEYVPSDFSETYHVFESEGYYLEIEGLTA